MTDDQLDREVKGFLETRSDEIVATALPPWQAAARARQRAASPARSAARPRVLAMVAVATLLLALLAAALVGSAPFRRPDPLPGNGLITFGLNDLGNRPYTTVHVVAPEGRNDATIGPGNGQTFSADGNVLAYWAGPWPDQVLTIVPSDGSPVRDVPGIEATSPIALSPDGSRIAWFKRIRPIEASEQGGSVGSVGSISELWVSPTDGGPGQRLVPPSDDPLVSYSFPVWSPDGGSIAFAAGRSVIGGESVWGYREAIHVVGADGSDHRVLTDHPGSDSASLAWSPDGRYVTYTALPDETALDAPPGVDEYQLFQGDDVFVIAADGTGERNLTESQDGEYQPQWAPDGTKIAWLGSETGDQLVMQRIEGSSPVGSPVIGPETDDWVWSPDSTRIAFTWSEDMPDGYSSGQVMDAAIGSIPIADLQATPTTILDLKHAAGGLSWQRLEPGALDPVPPDPTSDHASGD
jgi:Tol biopolymer transport system component